MENRSNGNYNNDRGWTLAHRAAWIGDTEILMDLKEARAHIKTKDNLGRTPVNLAARNGHTNALRCLKELRADMEAKDKNGMTPAHLAAWSGSTEALRYLGELGVNIEAKDNLGMTPTHWAAKNGYTEALECLIELKANLNVIDKYGKTPLDYAIQGGHTESANILKANGAKTGRELRKEARADIKTKNNLGRTHLGLLIHLENSGRNMEKIKDLLKKTDLNAIDKDGRTCLDLVNCLESMGDKVDKWIKDLLIEAGAKTGKQLDEEEKKQKVLSKRAGRPCGRGNIDITKLN